MEQKKSPYAFPDPNIDPDLKGKAFIMQYGKAMFATFKRSGYKLFYNNRTKYQEQIKYAMGEQSVDQYKQRLDCWENKDSSFLNLDWSILNLCSKFVNIVQGKLNKQDFNIVCTAIDALAIDQKKDYIAKLEAYQELQAWMQESNIQSSADFAAAGQLPPVDMDNDELQIFINMSLKHRWAMSMEKALSTVLNDNDFSQLKKELIWDLIVLGVGALKITEMETGVPRIEKCNPENIIVSNASSEKFKNMMHCGEVKMMTVSEFFNRAGSEFTDEQKKDIHHKYVKKYGESENIGAYGYEDEYEAGMIEVLDFVFKSEDIMVHERKKDRRGNVKIHKKKSNYPVKMSMDEYNKTYQGQRKVYKTKYDCLYKGLWIVNSEYICDYGKVENINRKDNMVDCFFPYILIAPNMQHGRSVSMVRQMMPVLNSIQINWLKFNDCIAKARPKGAAIDLDAIESVALGKGGTNWTPMQVLDLFEKKGYVVFRRSTMKHNGANGKPIEEIENGMSRDAMTYLNNVLTNINILRDITGLNDVTDASTPDPKLLKSVAEAAMVGTNNALDHLYHGNNEVYKDLCTQLSYSIVAGIKRGSITDLDDAIGSRTVRFFGENSDITAHKYGIKIENKPSNEEWNAFYATLARAVENGIIDPSDEAFCREIDNLKAARQYLIVRERKKQEQMAAAEQAKIEGAAQANQMAAQETIKMQKETTAIEIEGKIRLEQEKRATALAVEDAKRQTLLLQTQMMIDGKANDKVIEGTMKQAHIEQKGQYDLEQTKIKAENKPKKAEAKG